jgi:hypothetical protein
MATGSFARSSQSSPASFPSSQASTPSGLPYNRIKSRRRSTQSSNIDEAKGKRVIMEQTNQDALQLILDEIKARNHLEVRLMKRVRLNTFELAIKLL